MEKDKIKQINVWRKKITTLFSFLKAKNYLDFA